jgi:ABC-2 type transport system permease protein
MSSSFSSLSRAMARGFVRDKTAVFFTVLFPLMFLVLFGVLLSNPSAPRSEVIQVGEVSLLDSIQGEGRAGLDQVLELRRSNDLAAALEEVRKGDADAAVEEQGSQIVLHYSAADRVKAGTVQALFRELVQSGNLAANPVAPRFELSSMQVEDRSLKVIQYLTPGLLGWAVATGAMFGAALTLVTWRQKKVLRRLRLSPVRTGTVVGARVGVSIAIALVQAAIFIGVASIPFFGLKLSQFWWMAIPLLIAGTLAFLSIGLLAGSFSKNPGGGERGGEPDRLADGFPLGSLLPAPRRAGLAGRYFTRATVASPRGRHARRDGAGRGSARDPAAVGNPARFRRRRRRDRSRRLPMGRRLTG